MSHCIFRCSGNTSIIASTEISITESEITLVNNSSKISHYATTSTQTLRNIFANNRVHLSSSYLYMRFGIISNCTFGRADTYGFCLVHLILTVYTMKFVVLLLVISLLVFGAYIWVQEMLL